MMTEAFAASNATLKPTVRRLTAFLCCLLVVFFAAGALTILSGHIRPSESMNLNICLSLPSNRAHTPERVYSDPYMLAFDDQDHALIYSCADASAFFQLPTLTPSALFGIAPQNVASHMDKFIFEENSIGSSE